MYSIEQIWRLAKIRREELLREANQERLARQALAAQSKHDRFYCRASIWLGRQMITWGLRLQEHHGAAVAARMETAVNDWS